MDRLEALEKLGLDFKEITRKEECDYVEYIMRVEVGGIRLVRSYRQHRCDLAPAADIKAHTKAYMVEEMWRTLQDMHVELDRTLESVPDPYEGNLVHGLLQVFENDHATAINTLHGILGVPTLKSSLREIVTWGVRRCLNKGKRHELRRAVQDANARARYEGGWRYGGLHRF